MEKSFTLFCLVIAGIFAWLAYLVGHAETSFWQGVGSTALGFVAVFYVMIAIACSRRKTGVT